MKKSIRLNQENLDQLKGIVDCPTYDRDTIKTGIVHVGIGGFHRSHQALYCNELLQDKKNNTWGICGIALLPFDEKIYKILKTQDGLYTVMLKELNGDLSPKVIGAITQYLFAPDNPMKVIEKMAHAETKIITLTITEGGYNFDEATGEFIFDTPNIQHDLAHPNSPKSIFGYLAQAFKLRKEQGTKGLTVLSCDNIQGNGHITQKMVLSYIRTAEPNLVEWATKNIAFPNSMVDRITPVTTKEDISFLEEKTGIVDEWPVVCEPFRQWVIEDDFISGRPPWENVGAQFVEDVRPYEKMKLRLLNAGHSVLGLLGAIHGHKTTNECMEDKLFATYLRAFMDKEASPVLDTVQGIDLDTYKDSLVARFANPNIKDSVSRICSESSAKLPKFLIATIEDNLAQGGSIKFATLVIAAWCYYGDKGVNKNGEAIEIIDVMSKELHEAAEKTQTDTLAFIRQESIFGDLAKNERFKNLYADMVKKIYTNPNINIHIKSML